MLRTQYLATAWVLYPMSRWAVVEEAGSGTLEGSIDGADGATGRGWCWTSAVDGCLCREQSAMGDLDDRHRTVDSSSVIGTALELM